MKEINKKLRPIQVVDKIFRIIVFIFMIAYTISILLPMVWMIYTSLKPVDEFLLYPFDLPKTLAFENYADVFRLLDYKRTVAGVGTVVYGLGDMLFYSITWCLSTNLIQCFFFMATSYVICKYKFPGRELIYSIGVILMILPIVGTGAAALKLNKALGLYDNFIGRILISGSGSWYGFNFILLHGAWKSIPWEYAEAAFIDGGSHSKTFFRIMMPMIIPTVAVIFVLGFLNDWNNYLNFLTWLPSYPNLAVGIYMFQYNAKVNMIGTPTIFAGFFVAALPTSFLYLLSRKLIATKMNVGGLKG